MSTETSLFASDAYATDLRMRLEALKGMLITLNDSIGGYAQRRYDRTFSSTAFGQAPGPFLEKCRNDATREITAITSSINHLSACLLNSVNAHCVIRAFEALPGGIGSTPEVVEALLPMRNFVQDKVWKPEERRQKIFIPAFRILLAFGGDFHSLIREVVGQFPEETVGIEGIGGI